MKGSKKASITAVIITKNESAGIRRCVEAASFCDQVLVIDSHSTDGTPDIARELGAEVISFTWDGQYPKKKQWGMSHPSVRHPWVLHLDADEIVTPALQAEIRAELGGSPESRPAAYDIPLAYSFLGRELRYGHRVTKRSLVDRRRVRFPEIDDLNAPGITEVEGHYQPIAEGAVSRLRSRLHHDDPDPLREWISRHNKYSDWEAFLRDSQSLRNVVRGSRSKQGQLFDRSPFKPLAFFIYSYLLRGGFLDGRAGFDYAFALSWYYWSIEAKRRDRRRLRADGAGGER